MIILTTTADQTVQVGGAIVFDRVVMRSNNHECCNNPGRTLPTSSVKMVNKGNYPIHFHANLGGFAGQVRAIVQVGGVNLPETQMITTPAATADFMNVSAYTEYHNCCGDFNRVTVVNNGTAPMTVAAGACLAVGI